VNRAPLLGEWACMGILHAAPAHGFAVAARLKPDGDIGRVWSMSRALTYRSLDQLVGDGFVRRVAEEPGIAGGNRTILGLTRGGRAQFRTWLATPVVHLRDVRSELLLKIVLAEACGIDIGPMLERQRTQVTEMVQAFDARDDRGDVVAIWRAEAAHTALRFLERLALTGGRAPGRG
jgi:DNA-binding PadR family transcriptional regulator